MTQIGVLCQAQSTQGVSRTVVENEGDFYQSENSAGKNCYPLKGQRTMAELTEAIRNAAESRGMCSNIKRK